MSDFFASYGSLYSNSGPCISKYPGKFDFFDLPQQLWPSQNQSVLASDHHLTANFLALDPGELLRFYVNVQPSSQAA